MKKEEIKKITEYLKNRINDSWYYNSEDYGIIGNFIKLDYNSKNNTIKIYHEETNIISAISKKYVTIIAYPDEYNLYQLYSLWQENAWIEVKD